MAVSLALGSALCAGCFDEPQAADLSPPEVFTDTFVQTGFQAFAGSKLDALGTDAIEKYAGGSALKVSVPAPSDPDGAYAGGAFVATNARDLSGYNALTLWAKASVATPFDVLGLGNDNTGTSRYPVTWNKVPLTTSWARYVIPLPVAAKLKAEKGLFQFATASPRPAGHTVWFDEVRFEKLPASVLSAPRPAIKPATVRKEAGDVFKANDVTITYAVEGVDQTILAALPYFTWSSSNPAVATVDADGNIKAIAPGTALVTAKLGDVAATGAVTVTVAAAVRPDTPAPTPTHAPGDVISIYSSTYTSVPVDTFRADFSSAGPVTDVRIGSKTVKRYTELNFVGIEFITRVIDATSMAFFHLDFWTPDATVFKVKLVDFGANRVFGGGDDKEHELTFNATSTPALATSNWVSLDIPFSAFAGLTQRGNLAQLILSASNSTVFVDNIYFHK